jgi:hypothetical protein
MNGRIFAKYIPVVRFGKLLHTVCASLQYKIEFFVSAKVYRTI